uniref:Uncharacterized protein n=1 Tax=Arundo donax TaxID=35708 RepID=A0A0A9EPD6_ARUDO
MLLRARYSGWLLYTAVSTEHTAFMQYLLDRDPLLVFNEGEYGMMDMFYAAAKGGGTDIYKQMLDHDMSPRCSMNCQDREGANINGGGRGSRDIEQGHPCCGSRDDEHESQWRRPALRRWRWLLLPSSGCLQVVLAARSWPSLPQAPLLPRSCGFGGYRIKCIFCECVVSSAPTSASLSSPYTLKMNLKQ